MPTEADTCRKYVLPKLIALGVGQRSPFLHRAENLYRRRIVVSGDKIHRRRQKRADYLLRYTRDFTIAVIEAKAEHKITGDRSATGEGLRRNPRV